MKEILTLESNPSLEGLSNLRRDVVFASPEGVALHAAILTPWNEEKRYPAIVFVQGSAWTFPNVEYELSQLAWYANHGYVVMTVTHRNSKEGHPYPAFLQDVKTAIRFLRHNAEKYLVDPERVAIWGTSSGGNTAMLVQLTGDDPLLKTDEYPEQSDSVCCAVECFGPSDMLSIIPDRSDDELFRALVGNQDVETVARGMSPLYRLEEGRAYPPILMLHGDADDIVDYETQGLRMLEAYQRCGVDASMVCVHGAPHEGPFWSWQVHEQILSFLNRHMKES